MGVDAFTVYQEILSAESGIRINNIVSFGPTIGQLKVGAPSSALPTLQRSRMRALPVAAWDVPCDRGVLTGIGLISQVEAEGNTDSRPLPGFTPRKGKGLPVFGKSSSAPPKAKVECQRA